MIIILYIVYYIIYNSLTSFLKTLRISISSIYKYMTPRSATIHDTPLTVVVLQFA